MVLLTFYELVVENYVMLGLEVITLAISSIMAQNLRDLQHTVQLSLLQSQLNTGAASATQLIQQMNQPIHPNLGHSIDLRA